MPGVEGGATAAAPGAQLSTLDVELRQRGLQVEMCVVGGAILTLAFRARPGTRRPRAMFAAAGDLDAATTEVARRFDLDERWLPSAVRAQLRRMDERREPFHQGGALSILRAPAAYVMAMKCLELAWGGADPGPIERDLGYLLRFAGHLTAEAALRAIDPYLTARQRPDDLAERLTALLEGS